MPLGIRRLGRRHITLIDVKELPKGYVVGGDSLASLQRGNDLIDLLSRALPMAVAQREPDTSRPLTCWVLLVKFYEDATSLVLVGADAAEPAFARAL